MKDRLEAIVMFTVLALLSPLFLWPCLAQAWKRIGLQRETEK